MRKIIKVTTELAKSWKATDERGATIVPTGVYARTNWAKYNRVFSFSGGSEFADRSTFGVDSLFEQGCTLGKHCIVRKGAVFMTSCAIGSHSKIGRKSTIFQGARVGDSCKIGGASTIYPHCVFGTQTVLGNKTDVRHNCVFGRFAYFKAGVSLGKYCIIRPNPTFAKDVVVAASVGLEASAYIEEYIFWGNYRIESFIRLTSTPNTDYTLALDTYSNEVMLKTDKYFRELSEVLKEETLSYRNVLLAISRQLKPLKGES